MDKEKLKVCICIRDFADTQLRTYPFSIKKGVCKTVSKLL